MKLKTDLKELTRKIFVIFMIFQPILDIYMCLVQDKLDVFGVSLATIIRFAVVFVMTVLIMIYARERKSTKLLIGYAVLVGIYTIFHHINAIGFTIPLANARYSVFNEILYLLRMCIPIALIYVIYWLRPSYRDVKRIVVYSSLIISLTIVLTNYFKISYRAYSLYNDLTITDNVFRWFDKTSKLGWIGLSSRGFFTAANQISAVTVILIPVLTYIALRENKIKYWFVVLLHAMSMIYLTTRVSVVGGIILIFGISFIYFLQRIIHKEITLKTLQYKSIVCLIVIGIVYTVLFLHSPFWKRIHKERMNYAIIPDTESIVKNTATTEEEKSEKIDEISAKIKKSGVKAHYYEYVYPYDEDPDFWYELIQMPISQKSGNRRIRELFIGRILERDNRFSNYIWGISFTRASSFIWPEKDIVTHIDCIGITGIILFISPYLFILLFGIFKFFKNFKENLYLYKVIYLVATFIGILAGYMSGHVMNEVFPSVYLAMMTGIALNVCMGHNPEKYEVSISLRKYFDRLYTKGRLDFFEEVKENLLKEEKTFIVTANPETIMIAENNKELKKILLKPRTVIIPDGTGVILGAKMLGYPQKETITGIELVEKLFGYCDENKKSVFLFGAKPKVIEKLNKVLNKRYPNMKIVGSENGYVEDKQAVFEKIKEAKPDVVLVALGIPNQEIIIDKNLDGFDKGIFVGIGGSFDVLSGVKKRAPKIFIKLHLEWLYRILKEPKRIKRFVQSNIKYLVELSNEK